MYYKIRNQPLIPRYRSPIDSNHISDLLILSVYKRIWIWTSQWLVTWYILRKDMTKPVGPRGNNVLQEKNQKQLTAKVRKRHVHFGNLTSSSSTFFTPQQSTQPERTHHLHPFLWNQWLPQRINQPTSLPLPPPAVKSQKPASQISANPDKPFTNLLRRVPCLSPWRSRRPPVLDKTRSRNSTPSTSSPRRSSSRS